MKHWMIDITSPVLWKDLDLYPGDLLHGDIWIDKHAEQLRGIVQSIERNPNHHAYNVQFYGFPETWLWGSDEIIRVYRPTPDYLTK